MIDTVFQYKTADIASLVLLGRDKLSPKEKKTLNDLVVNIVDFEEKNNLTRGSQGLSRYRLNKWAKLVKIRDNFICYMCNVENKKTDTNKDDIESHHIYPKGDLRYVDKVYNLNNGISLCHRCHRGIIHESWVNWRKFVSIFRQYMKRKKVLEFNSLKQDIL